MDDKVAKIVDLAGVSAEEAIQYLEAASGDVNTAVELILGETNSNNTYNTQPKTHQPPTSTHTQPNANKPGNRGGAAGGVVGFSDLSREKKEEGQAFYAGGEKSGVQILGPPKESQSDIISNLFESAKKHGAVSKSDLPPEEKEKFEGSGFVLGNAQHDPSRLVPAAPKKQGPRTVVLTFYKDVFTIDDGPPRKLTDPANKSFLDDVSNQVVPAELEAIAGVQDLNIELIDKKHEEYKPPPKPKVVAFSGSGHSLGQTNTTNTGTTAHAKLVTVDNSQPVTSIQIRLNDGSRLVVKFNHNHTVGDIRSHIEAAHPTGKPFQLCTTYPSKTLINEKATIAEEGLLNASIVQR